MGSWLPGSSRPGRAAVREHAFGGGTAAQAQGADATAQAAVAAIGEVERLEELIKKVSRVGSWQELLGAAARPRGNGRRKRKE